MNGVEILSQAEVVTKYVFSWTTFWITGIIVALIIFVASIIAAKFNFEGKWWIPVVMILIAIAGGALIGAVSAYKVVPEPAEYETQYKVTVSDEVTFNEFQEHYEIIEQDGKIFTVRERK